MIRWASILLLTLTAAPAQETRKALVIGNGDYQNLTRLQTALPNARAFAKILAVHKFKVSLSVNTDAEATAREISRFLQGLQSGDEAVFYFSGYAVQDLAENYLLPIGFRPKAEEGIESTAYSLKRLLRFMEAKKLSAGLLVLETGYLEPALEKRFAEPGLAPVDPRASDIVIASSNLPGRPVREPAGAPMSRYTQAWVDAMAEPWQPLDALLRRIKQQVSQATSGEQVPGETSTMVREFVFETRSQASIEWEKISTSRDVAALEAFRARFPSDANAATAAARIRELEWEQAKQSNARAAVEKYLAKYPGDTQAMQWIAANESSAKDTETGAILAVLERYRKAYQDRDIQGILAVRPSFAPAERKRLEDVFRAARYIQLELAPEGSPAVQGEVASVKCRYRIQMRMDRADPPPVSSRWNVRLRRRGAEWSIETVEPIPD